MKELFTGLLSVSVSGSIVICLVLLFRLAFKKAPKALICLLWGIVILRLLLPFQFESPASLRPETPVFTKTDTTFFSNQQQSYLPEELPEYIPIKQNNNNYAVVVDYLKIASMVWGVVAAGMLIYTLVIYLYLKRKVRQAIKVERNIYESGSVDTPFLLGYIQPKIYLPKGMTQKSAELVVAHERNHIRRGDNWFKLVSFICLSMHWFNPLIWLAYMLICKDIEDACDESVVRELDEQGRREYSTALLACGKGKRSFAACPVAFGETSLRQRIMNVLNYKKTALWISLIAIVLIIVTTVFFMTDPATQKPKYYEELCKSMGQPIETVCGNLGVSQDDLVSMDPTYNSVFDLQSAVNYMDVQFDLRLWFSIRDGRLSSFQYTAQVPGDRQKAAAAAVGIGHQCLEVFGEPAQESNGVDVLPVTEATVEKLIEIYNVERVSGNMQALWQITDTMPQETHEYLLEYRESEAWKNLYDHQQIVSYPEMGLRLSTSRNRETDMITISIKVSVGSAGRNRYTPYPEKSWLDKVQDWLN